MQTQGYDMNDNDWLARQFEEHRSHLRTIAYRMLGSVTESEDAVQEAWLRLQNTESSIENLGSWLPEPIVTVDQSPNPEQEALIADSVGLALLVVLETLTPPERLAFVLHDIFAMPFDEIAPIVDRSPEAALQLASRARRRVQGETTVPDADLATQRRVVDAFLAA